MDIWSIIGIVVLAYLVIKYISTYNTLINAKNGVVNANSGIDAMLKMRHDLIPNLVATVSQYTQYERGVLESLTNLRTKALSLSAGDAQKAAVEGQISSVLKGLLVSVENYPQLKADETFVNLEKSINETEEEISAARRAYNSSVMQYNNTIQMFPGNLIAGSMGFSVKNPFAVSSEEGQNVSVKDLFKS